MGPAVHRSFITTSRELCRVCYTCVRECPAKAIRIHDGQAEIIAERCIACGNCVKVCSQGAKQAVSSLPELEALLAGGGRLAACLAPSFPAEFPECDPEELVGMLRQLGFELVCEVGFGADLVADRYRRLASRNDTRRYIATSCPAVVGYVERYFPELVDNLAPIVSPMVAEARVLRARYGDDLACVFIGPCIAKKAEAMGDAVAGEIDCAITFVELRQLLASRALSPEAVGPSAMDAPLPSFGALFPVSRGLLQAAGITEDLVDGEIVATDGRRNMVEAIKEFADGNLQAKLLEVLCCEGCIMGPGCSSTAPLFNRRSSVSRYVRGRLRDLDQAVWRADMARSARMDLSRVYVACDQRLPLPRGEEIEKILRRMGKQTPQDELNCGACGYDSCREHAVAIYKGLAESEMCLPYMIGRLSDTIEELEDSNTRLESTREQLMQSEKLASMGQLAAGIAHEVNNPLGVVLMYAHLLLDDRPVDDPVREDLAMIATQADRCKKIVAGLLDFARQNKVLRQPADVGAVITAALGQCQLPETIVVEREDGLADPIAEIDADQINQVLTNLITNAVAAMPAGGILRLATAAVDDRVLIRIGDTGTGIPEEFRCKIFEPFFTTKQIGLGTGLGLAIVYGIVKMHRGDIVVESNNNPEAGPTGTTFTITLPRKEEESCHV